MVADAELVVHVLADGKRALLSVEHFESALAVSHPVHDIQRETMPHGLDHRVMLREVLCCQLRYIFLVSVAWFSGKSSRPDVNKIAMSWL